MPILGKKKSPVAYGKIAYTKPNGEPGYVLVNDLNFSTIHDSPVVKEYIRRIENRYQLPKGMLDAVIRQESYGASSLKSKSGAEGFSQVMPSTKKNLDKTRGENRNAYDIEDAISLAAQHLRESLDRHNGSVKRALIDYNGGSERVKDFDKSKEDANSLPSETKEYVFGGGKRKFASDWYKKYLSEKKSDLYKWDKNEDLSRKKEDALITTRPGYINPKIKDSHKVSRKPQFEDVLPDTDISQEEVLQADKPFGNPEGYDRAELQLPEKVDEQMLPVEQQAPDIFKQNSAAIQKAVNPSRGPSSIDDFSTSENYPSIPGSLAPSYNGGGSYTLNEASPVNQFAPYTGSEVIKPQTEMLSKTIPMEQPGQAPYYLKPNDQTGFIPASQDLIGAVNQASDFSGKNPQPSIGIAPQVPIQFPQEAGINKLGGISDLFKGPEAMQKSERERALAKQALGNVSAEQSQLDTQEGPDQLPVQAQTQPAAESQGASEYVSPFQPAFDIMNAGTIQQYATAAAAGMEQQKILNDFAKWQKEDPGMIGLQKQRDNAMADAEKSYQDYKIAVDDFKKIKAVDPNRFWKDMSAYDMWKTAGALFLGAVANKNGENVAIKFLDAAQEKDLEAQKHEFEKYGQHVELSNNLIAHAYKRLGNIGDAMLAARRMKLEEVDMALKAAQAQAIAPQARAGMLIAIGQNELKRAAIDTELQARLAERNLKLNQIKNLSPYLRQADVISLMGGAEPKEVAKNLGGAMTVDPISGKHVTMNSNSPELMTKFTLGLEKSSQLLKQIDKLEPLVKSTPSVLASALARTDTGQEIEALVANIQALYKSTDFANIGASLSKNEEALLNKLTADPRSLTKDMLVSLQSLRQNVKMKIEAIREANVYGYKSPYSQLKKKSE